MCFLFWFGRSATSGHPCWKRPATPMPQPPLPVPSLAVGGEPAKANPNQNIYNIRGPQIERIVVTGLCQFHVLPWEQNLQRQVPIKRNTMSQGQRLKALWLLAFSSRDGQRWLTCYAKSKKQHIEFTNPALRVRLHLAPVDSMVHTRKPHIALSSLGYPLWWWSVPSWRHIKQEPKPASKVIQSFQQNMLVSRSSWNANTKPIPKCETFP